MIYGYEGKLGGGKTLSAVMFAVDALCKGAFVVTNVALFKDQVYDACRKYKGYDVSPRHECLQPDGSMRWVDTIQIYTDTDYLLNNLSTLIPSGTMECPNLGIIDEADVSMNSLDSAKFPRHIINYLKASRKIFIDLIFVAQVLENIHVQVRRQFQYIMSHRDMQKLKIDGLGSWPLPQLRQVMYDYDGKTVMGSKFLWKASWIFKLFDSHALFTGAPPITFTASISPPKKLAVGNELKMKVAAFALWFVFLWMLL